MVTTTGEFYRICRRIPGSTMALPDHQFFPCPVAPQRGPVGLARKNLGMFFGQPNKLYLTFEWICDLNNKQIKIVINGQPFDKGESM